MSVKVFISWSKEPSREIALLLQKWLRQVIQAVEPWVSDSDIDAGKKWSREIEETLEKSNVGILVVTRRNLVEPWLLFEAGAIAKQVSTDKSRAIPYCFDLSPADLSGPLGSFQGVEADERGTLKLVQSLNSALGDAKRSDGEIEEAFSIWWPKLFASLHEIRNRPQAPAKAPVRSDRDILEELLALARASNDDRENEAARERARSAAIREQPMGSDVGSRIMARTLAKDLRRALDRDREPAIVDLLEALKRNVAEADKGPEK